MAKMSQQSAPHKSFGYTAISVSSPDFNERMNALEKALRCMEVESMLNMEQNKKLEHITSMCFHAMRTLIEPREEENKYSGCTKTSTCHSYRRDLHTTEKVKYERLMLLLHSAEFCFSIFNNLNQKPDATYINLYGISLAKINYGLGMFFRKMMPESTHRLSSRRHFEKVSTFAPRSSLSNKAKFWIATFSSEFDDFSDISVDRCPEEYVVGLYSTFASNFDDLLVNKLSYETPKN